MMSYPVSSLLAVALLVAAARAACPAGCRCAPDMSTVRCTAVDRVPSVDYSRTYEVNLMNNVFSSPVLQKANLTGMANVETLSLKGCGLTAIERHTFSDLTRLESLDLSLNNLQVLPMGVLSNLRLKYLYLESNPKLSLREDVFSGMTTELLSLKNCDLTAVNPRVFSPLLPGLRKLRLEDNKIERFDRGMFAVFQNLEFLRFNDNPLICDCESKWLKEYYDLNKAKIHDQSLGNFEEPRCSSPDSLQGRFFSGTALADFTCSRPTLSANVSFTRSRGVLACASSGDPLPTVSWYKPNGDIQHSYPSGNMVVNSNTIELLPSASAVRGQYRCVATNDGGNVSLTVNVDWPFEDGAVAAAPVDCGPDRTIPPVVSGDQLATQSNLEAGGGEANSLLAKHFTLVDLLAGILGTFVCTLVITVVTLHFCVYRKRLDSQYSTAPPLSEYSSSSSGSDKPAYPATFVPLHHHQHGVPPQQRPLPKIYDDYHYMATNLDERDGFLNSISPRLASSQGRTTPIGDPCLACRMAGSSAGINNSS